MPPDFSVGFRAPSEHISPCRATGSIPTEGETEGALPIFDLCTMCRSGKFQGLGLLVQVGHLEDCGDVPGLLIDGQCTTCKGSSNRCTHTKIFNISRGHPGACVCVRLLLPLCTCFPLTNARTHVCRACLLFLIFKCAFSGASPAACVCAHQHMACRSLTMSAVSEGKYS
jgi:hypothetical protein